MLQGRLAYLESGHPSLQDASAVPDEFDDPHEHKALGFEYCAEAYRVFLAGSEVPDALEEVKPHLVARYGKRPFTNPATVHS